MPPDAHPTSALSGRNTRTRSFSNPAKVRHAMSRTNDILLTALAPAVWGSTYIVTTEALPAGYPVTLAALRALPAGLLLFAVTRCLPHPAWLVRTFLLGSLNFALFWALLFVAAYRLPGGVAATLGLLQAMMVILMARGCPINMSPLCAGGFSKTCASRVCSRRRRPCTCGRCATSPGSRVARPIPRRLRICACSSWTCPRRAPAPRRSTTG